MQRYQCSVYVTFMIVGLLSLSCSAFAEDGEILSSTLSPTLAALLERQQLSNMAYLLQRGDNNNAVITQHGETNKAAVLQLGNDNDSTVMQLGSDNTAVVLQDNRGYRNFVANASNNSVVTQYGNSSTVTLGQWGNTTGISIQQQVSGADITVLQYGN